MSPSERTTLDAVRLQKGRRFTALSFGGLIGAKVESRAFRKFRAQLDRVFGRYTGRVGRVPHFRPCELKVFEGSWHPSPLARSVLIVSHELSNSGAPKIVYEVARNILAAGHNVTVASPLDGPFRERLHELGATIVIDAGALSDASVVGDIVGTVDLVICNTIVTHAAVKLIGGRAPVYWYLHEISLLGTALNNPDVRASLSIPKQVWAGSELCAELLRPHRPDVEVFGYGLEQVGDLVATGPAHKDSATIAVFGSYEPRKGQDLALAAFAALPQAERSRLRLRFFGRVLVKSFYKDLVKKAGFMPEVEIRGELNYESYVRELLAADAVLVPSRDDTLPLVSLDALGSGRILICTKTTGTSNYLTHAVDGFVAENADVASIARVLNQAIDLRLAWPEIGEAGRRVFQRKFSREAFRQALISRLGLATLDSGMFKK